MAQSLIDILCSCWGQPCLYRWSRIPGRVRCPSASGCDQFCAQLRDLSRVTAVPLVFSSQAAVSMAFWLSFCTLKGPLSQWFMYPRTEPKALTLILIALWVALKGRVSSGPALGKRWSCIDERLQCFGSFGLQCGPVPPTCLVKLLMNFSLHISALFFYWRLADVFVGCHIAATCRSCSNPFKLVA